METYKDREDLIIMFTDSYDVVLLAEPETILAEFYKMKVNVVFGAEPFLSYCQASKRARHQIQHWPSFCKIPPKLFPVSAKIVSGSANKTTS